MARKDLSNYSPVDESNFRFTEQTITFGHYIYQISNITYVGVEEYKTVTKPPFFIFLSSLVAGIFWFFFPNPIIQLLGLMMILIGLWGLLQGDRIEKEYALIFETNSGEIQLFTSKDKDFLEKVVNTFYKIMDGKNEASGYVVNIDKAEIHPTYGDIHHINVNGSVGGNINTGHVYNDLSSSVTGSVT